MTTTFCMGPHFRQGTGSGRHVIPDSSSNLSKPNTNSRSPARIEHDLPTLMGPVSSLPEKLTATTDDWHRADCRGLVPLQLAGLAKTGRSTTECKSNRA